jgi:hypothetical protein
MSPPMPSATACNVPTSSPFRHISAQEFSWETLRSALAMLSHNRLPLSMGPTLHRSSYNRPSEHIHPAGIFIMYGWVVRLQLGDALMKSFTLIALMKPDILGLRLTPDATISSDRAGCARTMSPLSVRQS